MMKFQTLFAGVALMVTAACGGGDLATRAATDAAPLFGETSTGRAPQIAMEYAVKEVRVTVPEYLKVSEANMYYPIADIVWRGEVRGNRHQQVDALVTEAFERGTAQMTRGVPVILEAEVVRFHALTEKARYTVGGTYNTQFLLVLRDARTNEIIDGPRLVVNDTKASGGEKALEEEARGLTQKSVIVDALAARIRAELMKPASVAVPKAGLLAAL